MARIFEIKIKGTTKKVKVYRDENLVLTNAKDKSIQYEKASDKLDIYKIKE